MACQIIPFPLPLEPALPTVKGNVDYQNWRDQLLGIDQLLIRAGIEARHLQNAVQDWLTQCQARGHGVSAKAQLCFQERTRRALRCNIARVLLNEGFRAFARRLADSPLLQSFCGLGSMDQIRVPSKSELERFSKWVPESRVRELIDELNRRAHNEPVSLQLEQPVGLANCFIDTTTG